MTKKKHRLLLGAHMSIAGGIYKAIERGESIGCTVIQIFTKSNRQWFAKKLTTEDIEQFKAIWKQSTIKDVIAHAAYLINIGSPKKEISQKSTKALEQELKRCEELEIPYLIVHPGSHLNTNEEECLSRIAKNIDKIFENIPGKTKILLETMAGQGSSVCYTFEQIAAIIKQSSFKKRLGICFDTCHAFAAGYDFSTPKGYEQVWQNFDTILGLNMLKAIHINDSKKTLGSRVDRHEDIGKGKIGLEAFRLLFNDKRFFDIPKILETPKENLEDDFRNMEIIKKLISKENRKLLQINS